MRMPLFLTAISLALVPATAIAQTAEPSFSPQRVKADVEFLASDELEGRNAGTEGYEVAARFVATRFEAMGLQPGGTDGGWYQQVPLANVALDPANPPSLTIGQQRFASGEHILMGAGSRINEAQQSVNGEVVFVGHGFESEALGLDPYAGVDARGKFVAMLVGTPANLTPEQQQALQGVDRNEIAAEHGAIGVLMLVRPQDLQQFPWAMASRYFARPQTNWVDAAGNVGGEPAGNIRIGAYLDQTATEALFEGAQMSAEQIYAAAEAGDLRSFQLAQPVLAKRNIVVTRLDSPNVIGILPGSDPAVANETVLLSAHLDHDGVDTALAGDQIYNGAMDNAAGTATMLEAARAFMESGTRPRRSIMFVALTAEEDGLLGSEYLAKHPVNPQANIVANVNLDMPVLLYDFTDVVAFGAEHSTLGPIVEAAAARADVTLSPDPMPEENLFVRSDHYSFVKEGIPSVFLVTGFQNGGEEAFRTFLATHYHKVSDQTDLPFNWEAGAKFARINYLIAREIANTEQTPRWYEGNQYGERYAPDAPKAPAPAAE
ncbi:M20/M25/M40 family metallo-hydrolase [Sphingosinithalassobacter sp. CS137]|uniref:M20/M25/M40 family metallo-hydrolase n=1 Tax=Sphingosinithalassobacter sp. CS137 TaxID=2762748 RepID=UPI00165DC235|nr:M20/M25/M40 family metallo-hydrolase [Sphingosinithalassobacter sp. CS137]